MLYNEKVFSYRKSVKATYMTQWILHSTDEEKSVSNYGEDVEQ